MTTIVTQLDKDSVAAALRELAPKTHNPRIFRSTFEGEIRPDRVSIGYRFGWFAPPIRLVTFSGKVRANDDNTRIEGAVSAGWIFYVLGFWLILAAPFSLYRYASAGDFNGAIWSLVTAVLLYFLGRAFFRSTRDHVVREIGRAVRGRTEID